MKILKIVAEVLFDTLKGCKDNVPKVMKVVVLSMPFVMYFIGRGEIILDVNLTIPAFVYFVYVVVRKASRISDMPIPEKRFTEKFDKGVYVEKSRLQDMIFYMTDFEDWLEDNWWKK